MEKYSISRLLAIGLLATLLVSCQPATQETEGEGTKTAAQQEGQAKKAAAQVTQKVNAPAGTALTVRLTDAIDTGTTPVGARFEGALAEALVVDGIEVAPVGSKVTGKVTHVVSSGRLNQPAELSLVLTSITPEGGSETEIATSAWSMKGESHKKRNIGLIGGGAGVGAVVGAIAGGKKGAAIGGAVGAGAGTGAAAATGKKEIQLAPEAKLTFKLSAPAIFIVRKPA